MEVDLFGVGISILRHEFILIFLLWSFMGWSAAKSMCPWVWRETLGSETLQDKLLYSPSLSLPHLWVRNNIEWRFCEVGCKKFCPAPDFGIEIEMQGTLNRIKELVMFFCCLCVIASWIGWRVLISRAIKTVVWAFPTPISGGSKFMPLCLTLLSGYFGKLRSREQAEALKMTVIVIYQY